MLKACFLMWVTNGRKSALRYLHTCLDGIVARMVGGLARSVQGV